MKKIIVIRQTVPMPNEFEYDCWCYGMASVKDALGLIQTAYSDKEKVAYAYFKDIPGELQKGQKRGWLTVY